jgi:hypothetical protein
MVLRSHFQALWLGSAAADDLVQPNNHVPEMPERAKARSTVRSDWMR